MESKLISAVEAIDEKQARKVIYAEIEAGLDQRELSNQLNHGLQRVALRYEAGEYYIADLIMAGELVSNMLKILGMDEKNARQGKKIGKVVVGTVYDDIHDVGKNIFVSMLNAEGFEVVDIGTDVSAERFIRAIHEEQPDILGISGVLTSVVDNIKEVIDAITAEGLRDNLKIILGGALAGKEYSHFVGADGYSSDAVEGVGICKKWMISE